VKGVKVNVEKKNLEKCYQTSLYNDQRKIYHQGKGGKQFREYSFER